MSESGSKPASEPGGAQGVIAPDSDENIAFIKGLVANGQAAKAGADGKMPPGATHEIVGQAPSGLPIVKRRRFSAF